MKETAILNTIKTEELTLWNTYVTYHKSFGEDHPMSNTARTEWAVLTKLLVKLGEMPLLKDRKFLTVEEMPIIS